MLYQRYDEFEGVPVQFVGVYVLRWCSEWGEPTVAFAEADDDLGERLATSRARTRQVIALAKRWRGMVTQNVAEDDEMLISGLAALRRSADAYNEDHPALIWATLGGWECDAVLDRIVGLVQERDALAAENAALRARVEVAENIVSIVEMMPEARDTTTDLYVDLILWCESRKGVPAAPECAEQEPRDATDWKEQATIYADLHDMAQKSDLANHDEKFVLRRLVGLLLDALVRGSGDDSPEYREAYNAAKAVADRFDIPVKWEVYAPPRAPEDAEVDAKAVQRVLQDMAHTA